MASAGRGRPRFDAWWWVTVCAAALFLPRWVTVIFVVLAAASDWASARLIYWQQRKIDDALEGPRG